MIDNTTLEVIDKVAAMYQPPMRKLIADDYMGADDDSDFAELQKLLPIEALDAHALALMKFKVWDTILNPWLHTQDLCMVFAARGIGKTHFALAVAFAVATGGTFAKWSAPKPRKVLYLDGELPGGVMQQRLLMHCPDTEPEPGYLRIFTPDLLPEGRLMPDVSTLEGQAAIDHMIQDAEVVFVDNLSCWARSGRENEAESWLPIADWILSLRRRGIAVILIHHAGKGGQQRGTSKREDLLDVVISLSRPKDYDPTQGAVFVSEFTKSRGLTGDAVEGLELQLGGTEDRATWSYRTVESSTYDRVVALAKEGLNQSEIANELELNKSNVSRHLRKARELGDVVAETK
jgi:putative DNA primase/helicase